MEKYLNDLINQKQNIVNILTAYGVSATTNEGLNTLIPKLRSCLEYANVIQETAMGNPIAVGDVSSVEHSLDVKLTSKNLIPYPYEHTTKTANGVTFTDNGDGSITLNGTPTATATFYLYANRYNQTILKKGKQYTLSLNGSPSRSNIYINTNTVQIWEGAWGGAMGSTNSSNKETFTCDADYQGYQVYLVITKNAGTLENVILYPQLELGSISTAYTPYRTEFEGVEVSRYGKNLISTDNIEVSGTGTWTSKILTKQPLSNGTYTFSCEYENLTKNITTVGIVVRDIDEKWISETYGNNGTIKLTFSTTNGISIYLYSNMGSQSTFTDVIFKNIQLEEGSTVTDYETYKEPQTITANINGVVEGLTSLSPNMTLLTNNNDVVIDCSYNADTKTYIDNKVLALQTAMVGG